MFAKNKNSLNKYEDSLLKTIMLSIGILSIVQSAPLRIMPLGDSITRGYPSSDGYRNDLWYKLKDEKYAIDFVGSQNDGYNITPVFDSNHEGYGGFKTYELAEIVYGFLQDSKPDIILLHIGSNDTSPTQGTNSSSISGLSNILNQIDKYEQDYNHDITIMLSTIINRKTYHKTITQFNANLRSLASTRINKGDKIILADMENIAGLTSNDFADATHPNKQGYAKMANVWFSYLNIIIPTLIEPNPLIRPFVERFYNKILLRDGEEIGILHWEKALANRSFSASDLARNFILSDEFKNKNTSNETYVKILYEAFFDRSADQAGYHYWLNELDNGTSRLSILEGFLHSGEFTQLANTYDIRVDDI